MSISSSKCKMLYLVTWHQQQEMMPNLTWHIELVFKFCFNIVVYYLYNLLNLTFNLISFKTWIYFR